MKCMPKRWVCEVVAVVRLINPETRARAKHWLNIAEKGVIVVFRKPKRNEAQNAKMWAMIHDIIKQQDKHGRKLTPDDWKCVFMRECDHEVRFVMGLDNEHFPVGFSSSKMSSEQMGNVITYIVQWGDEAGIVWSDEAKAKA